MSLRILILGSHPVTFIENGIAGSVTLQKLNVPSA